METRKFRPGRGDVAADAFTRAVCASVNTFTLQELYENLCYTGVKRLAHYMFVLKIFHFRWRMLEEPALSVEFAPS